MTDRETNGSGENARVAAGKWTRVFVIVLVIWLVGSGVGLGLSLATVGRSASFVAYYAVFSALCAAMLYGAVKKTGWARPLSIFCMLGVVAYHGFFISWGLISCGLGCLLSTGRLYSLLELTGAAVFAVLWWRRKDWPQGTNR